MTISAPNGSLLSLRQGASAIGLVIANCTDAWDWPLCRTSSVGIVIIDSARF